MNRSLIVVLVALFTQGAWAETHSIKAFLADPVAVLDEQGKQQRELPKKTRRPNPSPCCSTTRRWIWCRLSWRSEGLAGHHGLRIEPPLNVVDLPCQGLTKSQTKDSRNNSTIGFGAGCNQ